MADDFNAAPVAARIRASAREGARDGGRELTFHAMGTQCRVVVGAPAALAREFMAAVLSWVAVFEAKYSRFLPDSLISRINRAAGQDWTAIDPETERVFAMCDEMVFLSRGAFDPTALPLIQLWNWKAQPPVLPSPEAIQRARELVGWRKVKRAPGKVFLPAPGMSLDLGGMGKELAVDQTILLAQRLGLPSALVDYGADVRVHGLPPDGRPGWHIGLEDPNRPGHAWRGLAVRNAAVATSGNYVRKFVIGGREYGHILDWRTGEPVDNGCQAVSVLAPSCTMAGMVSTTAFILGPVEGLKLIEGLPAVAGAIVTKTGNHLSRRFHEHVAS